MNCEPVTKTTAILPINIFCNRGHSHGIWVMLYTLTQLIIQMFFRSYSKRLNAEVFVLLYNIIVVNLDFPITGHYVSVYVAKL